MTQYTVLIFLTTFVVPLLAQSKPGVWRAARLPDPIMNPDGCGRPGPSFVCDPDNILPSVTVNKIDGVLKSIYNDTKVPCYSADPEANQLKGYMVMLAVVKKMQKYHTAKQRDSMRARYREAYYFTYHLGSMKKWGKHSRECNEMVVILFSVEDGVLYTMTQPTARRLVTDDIVQETLLDILMYYYPFANNSQRSANAVHHMVNAYSSSLRKPLPSN